MQLNSYFQATTFHIVGPAAYEPVADKRQHWHCHGLEVRSSSILQHLVVFVKGFVVIMLAMLVMLIIMLARDFYISTEWDVMEVPAQRNEKYYPCCEVRIRNIYQWFQYDKQGNLVHLTKTKA